MTATPTINIASHLAVMAGRHPDANAVLEPIGHGADGSIQYEYFKYHQLHRRSDALGRGLRAVGVERGSRVAVCVRPGFDFFSITFALFKIGAVPVLIDPGIGVRNFGRCLAEAQPTAFIGVPLAHVLRRAFRWARNTIQINISTGNFGGRSLREIERIGQADAPMDRDAMGADEGDLPAAILFTSGSTGPSKGVLYTHSNFDAQVRALQSLYNIQPGEIDLATFPLFGLFGPALGMTTVIPKMDFTRPGNVDAREIIRPILQLGITHLFGSPALLDRVGKSPEARGVKLPSLRRVISAGAPVSAKVLKTFTKVLSPGVQIFTPYGATESLPVCSIGSNEIIGETSQLTDQGRGVCVGRPAPGMRVAIVQISDEPIESWRDELQVPVNQVGEIVAQGPVVTASYFNRETATRLAKIPDPAGGFFHRMGDVGYFDDSGRLWFCGRKSQRVKTLAGDLYSVPFEAIFNTNADVARSALVSVERGGSIQPVMCIEPVLRSNISKRKLRSELLALAKRHAHTQIIEHILFHRNFPVDIRHNAKIGREKLAAWAARKLR